MKSTIVVLRLDNQAESVIRAVAIHVWHMDTQRSQDEPLDELSHQDTIDDESDVVSHQQSRDEVVGMVIKGVDQMS